MLKLYLFTTIIFISLLITSCSKKHHPGKTLENTSGKVKDNDSLATKKVTKAKRNYPVPKVIVVNDNVAHKSLDGRLYYDLLGHRYWKNYKDGKYYLYNKAMYTNDDFKPK
ncbi:MAG: hypothetical protein ABJA71_01445 [Ginsengibacter sp.]